MPNNPHEPTKRTRATVESMSGYGIPQEEIARVIGIQEKTLRKHYREELDTAATKANAKVAESLYKKATGWKRNGAPEDERMPPDTTAAIFWAKTRMKWKDTSALEVTGADGGPIQTEEVTARDRIRSRIASLAARSAEDADTEQSD